MHIETYRAVTAKVKNSPGTTRLLWEGDGREPLVKSIMAAFKDGDELVIMRKADWLGLSHGLLPKPDSEKAVQLLLLAREQLEADNSKEAQQLKAEMDSLVARGSKEQAAPKEEPITKK
jgi:hypothetical protein